MSMNDMNYEQNRLNTFPSNWQHPFVKKETLAKTGFYFVREPDFVTCQFCGVHLHKFDNKDIEVSLHFAVSIKCPLLRERPNQNVPLEPSSELEALISYLNHGITLEMIAARPNLQQNYGNRDGDKQSEPPAGECCCNCHNDSPNRKNPKANE